MKRPNDIRITIEPHISRLGGAFSWKVVVTAFDDAGNMETLYEAHNIGLYTEALEAAVQGVISELDNVVEEE